MTASIDLLEQRLALYHGDVRGIEDEIVKLEKTIEYKRANISKYKDHIRDIAKSISILKGEGIDDR